MQARTLGIEAAATGQGAGVAARWPPLIVGLQIESVSRTRVFVQRTGQASLIQNPFHNKGEWDVPFLQQGLQLLEPCHT